MRPNLGTMACMHRSVIIGSQELGCAQAYLCTVSHATIPAELVVDHPQLEVLVELQIRTAIQPVDLPH